MELFIRPLDTQFYRSSLPFDAGVDSAAFSVFPPPPRALYGAIRAEGFCQKGISLSSSLTQKDTVLGNKDEFGKLAIKGPLLVRLFRGEKRVGFVYLPFPFDLVKEKDTFIVRHLIPSEEILGSFSDLQEPELRALRADFSGNSEEVPVEQVEGYFLTSGICDYLCGEIGGEVLRDFAEPCFRLFQPEPRVGIKLSPGERTAQSGMLYQVWHYRLNSTDEDWPLGFYVQVEGHGDDFSLSQGILKLGGEGRPASYFQLESPFTLLDTNKERVINKIIENGRFKALLVTPGIFQRGAIPDLCSSENGKLKGSLKGHHFYLVAAALGKSQEIGGWDIQNKRPKTLRKAVPAGTVYFFQFENWDTIEEKDRKELATEVWEEFNFKSFCSFDPWQDGQEAGPGKEGFGIALIGGW